MHPTKLGLTNPNHLVIEWSDGKTREYAVRDLRDQCPCATCRDKRNKSTPQMATLLPVLASEETLPITISTMEPIGNYAYGICFSDGHDTGIFSLEMLGGIGRVVENS